MPCREKGWDASVVAETDSREKFKKKKKNTAITLLVRGHVVVLDTCDPVQEVTCIPGRLARLALLDKVLVFPIVRRVPRPS